MKTFLLKVIVVLNIVLIISSNQLLSRDKPDWVELQDKWYVWDKDILPDYNLFNKKMLNLKVIDVLSVLRDRKLQFRSDRIKIVTALKKPGKSGKYSIYIKTNFKVSSVMMNNSLLEARELSEREFAYKIEEGAWQKNNLVQIVVNRNEALAESSSVPAIFLTNEQGISRLRSGIIKVAASILEDGKSFSIKGPVFMKVLSDNEYESFKSNPEEYAFNTGDFWTTMLPSFCKHLLKGYSMKKLVYEFYVQLSGPVSSVQAIYLGVIEGPDETYINGGLIGKTGMPNNIRRAYYDRKRLYPIPGNLLKIGVPNRITIITHVSTKKICGTISKGNIRIGNISNEQSAFMLSELIAVSLAAIYLVVGLYFGLMFLQRRNARENLFFFTFAAGLAVYFFLRTQTKYIIFEDFYLLKKIEYIVLFTIVPSASLFIHLYFPSRKNVLEKILRGLFYIYLPVSAAFLIVPVLSEDIDTWSSFLTKVVYFSWIIPVVYILYIVIREFISYVIKGIFRISRKRVAKVLDAIDAFLKKIRAPWQSMTDILPEYAARFVRIDPGTLKGQINRTEADGTFIVAGLIIMLATAINDILVNQGIIMGYRLLPYGTLFFILGIAGVLANRFLRLHREVEKLNIEMNETLEISDKRAEYLEGIIGGVDEISKELVGVSDELNNIGNAFSNLSHEQASNAEEMAAIFEELTASTESIRGSVKEQAEQGKKTTELVDVLKETQQYVSEMSVSVLNSIFDISDLKEETGSSLKEMINRMQIIDEGGKSINNFVSMINEITDRINLLSLNAAIEAARAGEHGRGFAVVADEIGKLAAATSDNSKEISSKIEGIISDIAEGIKVVDNTKDSTNKIFSMLDSINLKVDSVKTLMSNQEGAIENVVKQADVIDALAGKIALSTGEQIRGMVENTKTVERLSNMAQEINVSSKRILKFTETIGQKANELKSLIEGTF